ncbi:MAG: spore cortex biosynthesis protein YabQ [Oscillospiraceae bacterium]|nr:spore cortex biosynthesis protein YabQ [Oscillospiraceae bacterium]
MHVDTIGQAAVFAQGFLLGAALGLLYDGMRTLRRTLRLPGLAFVLDLLFWLGAAAALFALTLLWDDGQVRIYHIAAVSLGGGAYFFTLSRLVLPALLWLADRIRALWRLVTAPVRLAGRAGKKFLENQKKLFQNWLDWYKINILYRFVRDGKEGAVRHEAEARRCGDKNSRTGAAGRRRRRRAVHSGQPEGGAGQPGGAQTPGSAPAGGQRRAGGRHRPQRRPGVPGRHRQK